MKTDTPVCVYFTLKQAEALLKATEKLDVSYEAHRALVRVRKVVEVVKAREGGRA